MPDVPAKKRSAEHDALGRAVRSLRARKDWSLEELADRVGTTRNYLSEIERGLINPTFYTLRRVAKALEVPLSWLIAEGEDVEREDSGG